MGKKIYICETMQGSGIKRCSGHSNITSDSYGDYLQTRVSEYLTVPPNFVKISNSNVTQFEGSILESSKIKSARLLNLQLKNFYLWLHTTIKYATIVIDTKE